MLVKVSEDGKVLCGWFAKCERPADGVVEHPVLGQVPTCETCAGVAGQLLWLGGVTLEH